jgi:hypothetical protein
MTPKPFARLGLALLLVLPVAAQAQDGDRPPLPERNPLRAKVKKADTPVLPREAPTVDWTEGEVRAGKAECAKILAGLELDYEPLPPIKEGKCGAPAPILLKAIGSEPRVEVDPPATVTCRMARALSAWLDKTVQPEARTRVGTPVVKLANASSYVCRNRYNGTDTLLSEHALANALDVSEFVFQSGEKVTVLASWPRLVTAAETPAPRPQPVANKPAKMPEPSEVTGTTSISKTNPFVTPSADRKSNPFVVPTVAAKTPLPRPPAETTPPRTPPSADGKGQFVTKVHREACGTFGTVLGPEANEAHRDHFHFDMKARSRKAYCE